MQIYKLYYRNLNRVFIFILYILFFLPATNAQENNSSNLILHTFRTDSNIKSLYAKYQEGKVFLNIIANGIKTDKYYTVERSSDGNIFETIGMLRCFGNSSNFDIFYSFVDNYPLYSTIYYRLVFRTSDNDSVFSNTINILAGTDKSNLYVTIADDIWIINQKNDKMVPLKLDFNTKDIECNAFLSPDGFILYFVSDRKGGFGGKDIWAVEKLSNGNWSEPFNLGKEINTAFDEDFPIVTEDNDTLYFKRSKESPATNNNTFFSIQSKESQWTKPESTDILKNVPTEYYSKLNGTLGEIKYTHLVKRIENTTRN